MRNMLVVVRLKADADIPPLGDQSVAVMAALTKLSAKRPGPAFTSASGETFGAYVRTDKPAAVVRAAIERSLQRFNSIIVFAINPDDFSAIGESARWGWLQH